MTIPRMEYAIRNRTVRRSTVGGRRLWVKVYQVTWGRTIAFEGKSYAVAKKWIGAQGRLACAKCRGRDLGPIRCALGLEPRLCAKARREDGELALGEGLDAAAGSP